MGADPLASAAIGAEGGDGLIAFFVRKEKKEHGLQRWIEGPVLEPGTRCLVVEDVVTTGGSTVRAIERILEEGHEIAGVVSVVDRLAGGGEAIEEASAARPTGRSSRSTSSIPSAPTGPDCTCRAGSSARRRPRWPARP